MIGGPKLAANLLAWAMVALVRPGLAGGLRHFQDAWPVGAGQVSDVLSSRTDSGFFPAGMQVRLGQGRLFSMAELAQSFLEIGGGRAGGPGPWNLAGSWERTGKDIYREDRFQGKISFGSKQQLLWGMSLTGTRLMLGRREYARSWQVRFLWGKIWDRKGLQMRWRVQVPLLGGAGAEKNEYRRNFLEFSCQFSGAIGCLVMDRSADGRPQWGGHLLWRLSSELGLGFRFDQQTGMLGPGFDIRQGRFLLRTSHLVHPALGLTHRLMLVVGGLGGAP